LTSPPIWLPLLWPLGYFSFPVASALWLAFSVLLLLWISRELELLAGVSQPGTTFLGAESGGNRSRLQRFLVFLIVVTFGPVTLALMLGQNSIILLAGALSLGACLQKRSSLSIASLGFAAATAGKIYPASWLVPIVMMRRWKLVTACILFLVSLAGLTYALFPTACEQYVKDSVPRVLGRVTGPGGFELDDQSLFSVLRRLTVESDYAVPLVSISKTEKIRWKPSRSVDPARLLFGAFILSLLLLAPACVALAKTGRSAPVANFYIWVLVPLLFFPHVPRYNHVLLLPALAWLLTQGGTGLRIGILGYLLVGLSRLTHLWAVILPSPWGPLASGFGLYAVIVAILGMAWLLVHGNTRSP